jgi:GntR family transcriptional regulator/MocR family aminotransferase
MPRTARDSSIALGPRPAGATLTAWLYTELRAAILTGRLRRGARLPATRDLAASYGVSRRVVVNVFEQLRDEGYLSSRVGVGTTVSQRVPEDYAIAARSPARPATAHPRIDRLPAYYRRPARPFRPIEPALDELPIAAWTRVSAQVLRRLTTSLLAGGDLGGLPALRDAIAGYLGSSRGVACNADQIVIVSGAQQALDLLARVLVKAGDAVWIEDPGYGGARDAFRNAGARIVPVRVDDDGLDPAVGLRLCPRPKAVYLTPAHQFPLGTTLSLTRRFDLLRWARTSGTVLIEDDYDSEFRFSGRPVPAMKGLDGGDSVFLIGTFNKVLFPALRLGYIVVPEAWIDRVLALRYQADRHAPGLSQATLARFIEEGHFSRHLRRMRELYGRRRLALAEAVDRHLRGVLVLPEIMAGLSTPAYLLNGMSSKQAATLATRAQVEAWALDRFALKRRDLRGLLLGFAAFTDREIRAGVQALATALS